MTPSVLAFCSVEEESSSRASGRDLPRKDNARRLRLAPKLLCPPRGEHFLDASQTLPRHLLDASQTPPRHLLDTS